MYKYIAMAVFLAFSIPAIAVTETDQALLENGVVDENFVYTDLRLAGAFFKSLTESMSVSLPQKISSDLEWSSVTMTPYRSYFLYTYSFETNEEEALIFKEIESDYQFINETCQTYFRDEFLKANNHTVVYSYLDVNRKHLFDMKMNKDLCRKALIESIAAPLFK